MNKFPTGTKNKMIKNNLDWFIYPTLDAFFPTYVIVTYHHISIIIATLKGKIN